MARTYCRPLDNQDGKEVFETWGETVDRTISHQRWLWERAKGSSLTRGQREELYELREIQHERLGLLSGRTLWLGGTEVARTREASQFNCAFTVLQTVYDMVDLYWLLLQGSGVGFRTKVGSLFGFAKYIPELEVIRSTRKAKGGRKSNNEWFDTDTGIWTIQIGDSSESWAKALGKLVSHKHANVQKLVLDFTHIRAKGARLSRYGWQSCGDEKIARAFKEVFTIMNNKADQMLSHQNIHDIANLCGTTLSNRRAAELSLFYYGEDGWEDFANCKTTVYNEDFGPGEHWWRDMSNNTLCHRTKPTKHQIRNQLLMMAKSGGSEPAFLNEKEALRRAPWFNGPNPCVEILLANKGFCNLVTINLAASGHRNGEWFNRLLRTIYIMARANYRQTCVDLRDGILQRAWHDNNQMLRLCGVSLAGIAQRTDITAEQWQELAQAARFGANEMADDLGLPRPKNVTCGKPEGTAAKIMGSTVDGETCSGIHNALGRFEFNKVNFGSDDPILSVLFDAGYKVDKHPTDPHTAQVTFPVDYGESVPGVVHESAVEQLERYKGMMTNWCDQNMSCTIYWTPPGMNPINGVDQHYHPGELDEITSWLDENWDTMVAVSFLPRQNVEDLTKPEKQVCQEKGYAYLPIRIVSETEYRQYTERLKPIDESLLSGSTVLTVEADDEQGCDTGVCPVK